MAVMGMAMIDMQTGRKAIADAMDSASGGRGGDHCTADAHRGKGDDECEYEDNL